MSNPPVAVPIAPADLAPPRTRSHLGGLLGLLEGAERPFPLRSMSVRAHIAGDVCRTVVEQCFVNAFDVVLDVVHIFPLPSDAVLTEVELRAGDRTVRAECRPREEAEAVFDAARRAGHRGLLVTEERGDVHTLRAANIAPGTDVAVRMVFHERLEHADGRFLWRWPTVIAPRYLPGTPIGHTGPGVLPDTDHVPDASNLQPPLRLAGGALLDLEVEIEGPLAALESSLHAVRVDLTDARGDAPAGSASADRAVGGAVRVAPSGRATLDRDFVLAFSLGSDEREVTRAWSDGRHTLVVVEPAAMETDRALPRDAVFVVDISGSMFGDKIAAARLALQTALHGLAAGDRFMLLAFDDRLERFEDGLIEYNGASLARADAWVRRLEPRGGTEMLPAVQTALAGDTPPGRLRTVLLVTDGQVWNEDELVAAVAARRGDARLFTMGIDTAVNASLLARLARTGGGTCELLAPSDDIEAAVARLEARFGSPLVDDVRALSGPDAAATAADDRPRTLFAGRPVSLMLEGAPASVTLRGRASAGDWSASAMPRPTVLALGALWARERVAALEDRLTLHPHEREALRPAILDVAMQYGIVSRFTAFVAVDTSITASGERVEVVQPVELPSGWDPRFRQPLASPAVAYSAGARGHALASSGFAAAQAAGLPPMAREWRPGAADADIPAFLAAPRASLAREPARQRPRDAARELAGSLARSQRADGGFGDVAATAAALVALVLLGHTRRKGDRRRVVAKCEAWLRGHAADANAALALEALARAEGGEPIATLREDLWARLLTIPGFARHAGVLWPDRPTDARSGAHP